MLSQIPAYGQNIGQGRKWSGYQEVEVRDGCPADSTSNLDEIVILADTMLCSLLSKKIMLLHFFNVESAKNIWQM